MNGLTAYQLDFISRAEFAILTIREAAIAFNRHPSTIRYQISRNNVIWRKTVDGVYLLMRESLIAYYGIPHGVRDLQARDNARNYVLSEEVIVHARTMTTA